MTSILKPSGLKSAANLIASVNPTFQQDFLKGLSHAQLAALPYLFEFWAMPHQLPPGGDWRTWVVLGGRGAGKTRAGAEWVRTLAEGSTPSQAGRATRIALIGETIEQAREVMVFGESGILAVTPPDRRPEWLSSRRMLRWPNGCVAQVFSAHDPEGLRGPQFDAAWADEFAKWPKASDAWDMLQFGLRLGDHPQACVTTTPRKSVALRRLLASNSTVSTHASTYANRANLADGFMDEIEARYSGTSLGRQEIEGVILDDIDDALWKISNLAAQQLSELPDMHRVVVAIDPPAGSKERSDECGILVVGVVMSGPPQKWRAYVLEDATVSASSPTEWAEAALAAVHRHGADRLVAEVNQGGDMVETILRQIDPMVPYKSVHATKGKAVRAEPAAALYEQGRVWHARGLGRLEDQMCQMTTRGFEGKGSPDRVDALVWALHDLMIAPVSNWRKPSIRGL